MDTDSFVLSIKTKDVFENLYKLKVIFDFSNLNKEKILVSKKKRKICLKNSELKLLKNLDS